MKMISKNNANYNFKNLSQAGSILLIVIIFILLSGMIMTFIFKFYFSSFEIIKNHKNNQKAFNNFLSPKNSPENNVFLFPKIKKDNIDFNNLLSSGALCPIKNVFIKNKDFISDRFCEISNINNLYIGNIISKKSIKFPFSLLVSSGSIFLEHELIITQDTTILSLGDIEILNIIGEDLSKNYSIFFQSETNNVTIKHASNIKTLSFPFITLPSYKQNVFAIKF